MSFMHRFKGLPGSGDAWSVCTSSTYSMAAVLLLDQHHCTSASADVYLLRCSACPSLLSLQPGSPRRTVQVFAAAYSSLTHLPAHRSSRHSHDTCFHPDPAAIAASMITLGPSDDDYSSSYSLTYLESLGPSYSGADSDSSQLEQQGAASTTASQSHAAGRFTSRSIRKSVSKAFLNTLSACISDVASHCRAAAAAVKPKHSSRHHNPAETAAAAGITGPSSQPRMRAQVLCVMPVTCWAWTLAATGSALKGQGGWPGLSAGAAAAAAAAVAALGTHQAHPARHQQQQ